MAQNKLTYTHAHANTLIDKSLAICNKIGTQTNTTY